MRLTIAFLIAAWATNSPAAEDGASAEFIMKGCTRYLAHLDTGQSLGEWPFIAGMCLGTVRTILDTRDVLPEEARMCPPQRGVTYDHAVRVIVTWINDRPERIQEKFIKLSAEAMRAEWPCN